MKIGDIDWNDISNLDEKSIKIIGNSPIYYNMLPAIHKTKWIRSGDGVIMVCGGNHLTNGMFFGKINPSDLNIDNPIRWYYVGEKTTDTDNMLLDFIVDWNEKELKKYKQKNSTQRRIQEQNITIAHYKGSDPSFYFDARESELEKLFLWWNDQTKTEGKRDYSTREIYANCNSKNIDKFVYRCNGVLAGFQAFENFLGNVYWHVNILNYNLIGKSCVAWSYPIEYYNQPIHYLGAGTDDNRLMEHKMRICRNKYITFNTIFVPSTSQSSVDKREQKLEQLYTLINYED